MAGESEIQARTVNIKNLETGEQTNLPVSEVLSFFC
ncbi:MAG: hypothetical protein II527_03210 [Bacteroidales bacterium]|nr:hypothetical protein [Bacteroidales bacterium]